MSIIPHILNFFLLYSSHQIISSQIFYNKFIAYKRITWKAQFNYWTAPFCFIRDWNQFVITIKSNLKL